MNYLHLQDFVHQVELLMHDCHSLLYYELIVNDQFPPEDVVIHHSIDHSHHGHFQVLHFSK